MGKKRASGAKKQLAQPETPNEIHAARPISGNHRPPGGLDEAEFRHRVAHKAYELFERRGGEPGRDVDDWLEAERLVRQELAEAGNLPPGLMEPGVRR